MTWPPIWRKSGPSTHTMITLDMRGNMATNDSDQTSREKTTANGGGQQSVRVILVDDHPTFRAGLRSILERKNFAQVLGEASSGDEAVELAVKLRPDLVIMDLGLPKMSGVQATEEIVGACPETIVMVLTVSGNERDVLEAAKVGAKGYLRKDSDARQIRSAIERLLRNEIVFEPTIAPLVEEEFAQQQRAGASEPLSELEKDVLALRRQGHNFLQIAKKLKRSEEEIGNTVKAIWEKLQSR